MTYTIPDFGPSDLLTSEREGFRRLRADIAQTSFFEGREFRTFKYWSTPTTAVYVIKVSSLVNTVLFEFGGTLTAGSAIIETVVGGTEGGAYAEVLPIISANTMTTIPQPPYVSQMTITAGGTLTGGVQADVFLAKAADNSNFAGSVGGGTGSERGAAPGTFYYRITLTDAVGVLKGRWEERP